MLNPLQDTAEPISEAGGASEKTFKEMQNCWTERGGGNKKSEKQWEEHRYPLQPVQDSQWRSYLPKELKLKRESMLEQGRSMIGKERQRGNIT